MGEALGTFDVSLETRAILLLCATFGPAADEDCKPLSPREFEQLVRWLQTLQMRPLDLLGCLGCAESRRRAGRLVAAVFVVGAKSGSDEKP